MSNLPKSWDIYQPLQYTGWFSGWFFGCFSSPLQHPLTPSVEMWLPGLPAVHGSSQMVWADALALRLGFFPWLSHGSAMGIQTPLAGKKSVKSMGLYWPYIFIVFYVLFYCILLYLPNIYYPYLSIPCPKKTYGQVTIVLTCFDHGMEKCRRHAKASSADSWVSPTEWENNSAMLVLTPGMLPKDAILASKHNFLNCNLAICDDRDGDLLQPLLWKITIFHGKIHYKWPFSIVMLVITRGYLKKERKNLNDLATGPQCDNFVRQYEAP